MTQSYRPGRYAAAVTQLLVGKSTTQLFYAGDDFSPNMLLSSHDSKAAYRVGANRVVQVYHDHVANLVTMKDAMGHYKLLDNDMYQVYRTGGLLAVEEWMNGGKKADESDQEGSPVQADAAITDPAGEDSAPAEDGDTDPAPEGQSEDGDKGEEEGGEEDQPGDGEEDSGEEQAPRRRRRRRPS